MSSSRVFSVVSPALALIVSLAVTTPAQQRPRDEAQQQPAVDPSLFADMKWRNIGPYRGGRTKAAAGHATQPHTFYIGMVNGGVW